MTDVESLNFLNQLLEQEPEEVRIWLDEVISKHKKAPDNFNWSLFTSKTSSFASSALKSGYNNLIWIEIAIAAYQFLLEICPQMYEFCLDAVISLRIFAIINLGVIENHPILDVKEILALTLNHIEISPRKALLQSQNWKETLKQSDTPETQAAFEQNLQKIRSLRKIKTKVAKIKTLVERKRLEPNSEIESWLRVWSYLP